MAAEPRDPEDVDRWRFELTPYLWLASIEGSTGGEGVDVPIDSDYSFFSLDNLGGFFAADFLASRGQWSIGVDGLYLRFEDEYKGRLAQAGAELDGGFIELTGRHRLAVDAGWELLAGGRYIAIASELEVPPGPGVDGRESWIDPVIGVLYGFDVGEKWDLQLRADIGGFGVGSDFTTNLVGSATYRFTKHIALRFAYRYLDLEYDDELAFNLRIAGPVLGLGIAW